MAYEGFRKSGAPCPNCTGIIALEARGPAVERMARGKNRRMVQGGGNAPPSSPCRGDVLLLDQPCVEPSKTGGRVPPTHVWLDPDRFPGGAGALVRFGLLTEELLRPGSHRHSTAYKTVALR